MPLPAALVGASTAPVTATVDARWTMAFAAALGEVSASYYDTAAPDPVPAHPLFPVCLEWPAVTAARRLPGTEALSRAEAARGVHAGHDLHQHRPVRAGSQLTTVATVWGIEAKRSGALQTLRLDTTDEAGAPVVTTWMTSLFRGVSVDGPSASRALPDPPARPPPATVRSRQTSVEVPATAAHVYTECSRIWNPIHTDLAVARAAGLPGPILHGTATLAMAVSRVVAQEADGDPTRVRRVCARFGAMVTMPSTLVVETSAAAGGTVTFTVRTEAGDLAVRDGLVVLDP